MTVDTYKQRLRIQLDDWDEEIGKLEALAHSAEADAQLEYDRQVEELRVRQRELRARLDGLAPSDGIVRDYSKANLQSDFNDLEDAIRELTSRFE